MFESEGTNGIMYSEDMDFGGEYFKTITKKLSVKDPFYYHTHFFSLEKYTALYDKQGLRFSLKLSKESFGFQNRC